MGGMNGMRGMLAAAMTAAALLLSPAAARAEPALWTLRDADSTLLLFGSVHLLPDGLDWRPATLYGSLWSSAASRPASPFSYWRKGAR